MGVMMMRVNNIKTSTTVSPFRVQQLASYQQREYTFLNSNVLLKVQHFNLQ